MDGLNLDRIEPPTNSFNRFHTTLHSVSAPNGQFVRVSVRVFQVHTLKLHHPEELETKDSHPMSSIPRAFPRVHAVHNYIK